MDFIINFWIFTIFSLFICVMDIKHKIIPDVFVFLCLILMILCKLFFFKIFMVFINLICGLLCALIFLLARKICKKRLGLGDVKYALCVGFISKPFYFSQAIFFSAMLGLICFFFIKLLRLKCKSIPFAPFIFLGTLIHMGISKNSPLAIF